MLMALLLKILKEFNLFILPLPPNNHHPTLKNTLMKLFIKETLFKNNCSNNNSNREKVLHLASSLMIQLNIQDKILKDNLIVRVLEYQT